MSNLKSTSMSEEEYRFFLKHHSFGTLISTDLQISHIPFIFISDNIIETHLARTNPQLASLHQQDCVLSILGPHAFIASDYYLSKPAVPTWNYASVNITGISRHLTEPELKQSLLNMMNYFQPHWRDDPEQLPTDFLEQLINGIIGIRIEITNIQGKVKFGQHKSQTDQDSVFARLSNNKSEDANYARLAQEWLSRFRTPP